MWWNGNYGIEFQMTLEQAQSASHSGQCDDDVEYLVTGALKGRLKKLKPDVLARELAEYGAWDDEQLKDHAENLRRIVWIAASDIVEQNFEKKGR